MDLLFKIILAGIAIQFVIELSKVLVGLEKHQYIGGHYQHSIEHFAYLGFYLTGTILLITGDEKIWATIFILLGTIILNVHIRKERIGKFN